MDRKSINLLLVDDEDLNCEDKKKTLTDLTLVHLTFKPEDIAKYELIVYKGKKGTKVLKSSYFKIGKIG